MNSKQYYMESSSHRVPCIPDQFSHLLGPNVPSTLIQQDNLQENQCLLQSIVLSTFSLEIIKTQTNFKT
jgi:hypothetical protein